MRQVTILAALAFANAPGSARTLDDAHADRAVSLAQLRAGDAMAIVAHVLPGKTRAEVVSGYIRREHHLPGQAFDVVYHGRAGTDMTDGLCQRVIYRATFHETSLSPTADEADPAARLKLTQRSDRTQIALAQASTSSNCIPATGFVPRDSRYPDRQRYALRTLNEIISVAGQDRIAATQIVCEIDETNCADPAAHLAALDPMALSSIRIISLRRRCEPAKGRVRQCSREPIGDGEPFRIEASVLSPKPGRVWSVTWIAQDGEPLAISLRETVIPPF